MKTRRVVLIVLLVAVMLLGTTGVLAQGGTHTVQTGENLYRIALQYGLTVEQIAAANGITNPDQIYIGQVLVIPGAGGTGGPVGSTVSYTVVTGDTLFSIAQRSGSNVDTLVALNGLDDADVLYIGQVILVPASSGFTGTGGPTAATTTAPAATGEQFTYKVERGVTLSHIAYFYNTTIQQIALLNNLEDARLIVEGQELLIQGTYREGSPLEVGGPGWFPDGTTSTGSTSGTDATTSPTTGPILSMEGDGATWDENRIYFVIPPGAEKKCVTITSSTEQAFSVADPDAETIAFNANLGQTTEQAVFTLERPDVAMYIDLSFEGGVKPDGCDGDPLICNQLTYTLCAAATPDALTGGHQYYNDVILRYGTQLYDQFYGLAQTTIPLKFQVPAFE